MNIENNSNHDRALEQWNVFYNLLTNFCDVELIEPQPDLPDMVFTANAGLPIQGTKQVVLSKFKFPQRSKEEFWFKNWFFSRGYEVIDSNVVFEGAGDALYLNGQLIAAHGFRSEKDATSEVQVKLIDPNFYHLDTCFCPLNHGDFLIYPQAFDVSSFEMIKSIGRDCIEVSESEAFNFACNAVVVENVVLMPKDCPNTLKALKDKGYEVFELDMSEFLKSGGACKCLTLELFALQQ